MKVADFGIARAVSSQTMNATAVGSVHYISPEQARGGYCEREVIYIPLVLPCMKWSQAESLLKETIQLLYPAHLETPITPPSQLNPVVSSGLEQIILKCTQKKPDRRYSSIGDVITDLRHVMVDPDYDIYGAVSQTDEENDPYVTRPISREELSQIQERRRPHTEDIVVKEPEYDPAVSIQTPETEENDGDGYDKEETQPQIPVHKKRSTERKKKM